MGAGNTDNNRACRTQPTYGLGIGIGNSTGKNFGAITTRHGSNIKELFYCNWYTEKRLIITDRVQFPG